MRRSYPLAPARPYWKGYLKLSLVTCPIALYPAISSEKKVAFRQVSRRTGNRLRHQLVDSVSGEIVESHDKGRGYEVGHNRFVMVEDRGAVCGSCCATFSAHWGSRPFGGTGEFRATTEGRCTAPRRGRRP